MQTGEDDPVTLSPEMATMLAVSADGTHAAMTTSAGHLQIWDVASGRQVATFDVAPDRFTTLDVAGPAVVAASPERGRPLRVRRHDDRPADGAGGHDARPGGASTTPGPRRPAAG